MPRFEAAAVTPADRADGSAAGCEIPTGAQWVYEPKWDGFRCVAFRDGDDVELESKSGQSLTRYFPEIVERIETRKATHVSSRTANS